MKRGRSLISSLRDVCSLAAVYSQQSTVYSLQSTVYRQHDVATAAVAAADTDPAADNDAPYSITTAKMI